MFAMLARVIQFCLAILGLLFVGVALFAIRTGPATTGGFFQAMEANLRVPLYLFLGFLCLLVARRISRGRKKKSDRQTSPSQKG